MSILLNNPHSLCSSCMMCRLAYPSCTCISSQGADDKIYWLLARMSSIVASYLPFCIIQIIPGLDKIFWILNMMNKCLFGKCPCVLATGVHLWLEVNFLLEVNSEQSLFFFASLRNDAVQAQEYKLITNFSKARK